MSKIITYKDEGPKGVYSQLKLDSGKRILVSIGDGVVKIYKMGFGGMLPVKTVWGPKSIAETALLVADSKKPARSLLEATVNRISDCETIDDVLARLKEPANKRT